MRQRYVIQHKKSLQWVVIDRESEYDDLVCKTREEARQKAREMNTRVPSIPPSSGASTAERH